MDISRMKNDAKLNLCRKYYYGKLLTFAIVKIIANVLFTQNAAGFAFLPFLWAINFFWFRSDAFRNPSFEEQSDIRKCK